MSSREEFEAWYLENWGHTEDEHETLFERDPDSDEEYYRLGVRMCHQAWQAATNAMEAKCAALAAENAGLNAFVDALLSIAWQGGSADGAEIQELALKHGLLRQEVYSADEHETLVDDPGNFEDGDPVYFRVETPVTDAYLAEVGAQGVESLSNAVQSVISERQRQQSVEGWTPKHDDKHDNNELAFAASCYAFHSAAASWDFEDDGTPYNIHPAPKNWPWAPEWWKPTNPRRDLVKAGALILAEIERIDRQEAAQ